MDLPFVRVRSPNKVSLKHVNGVNGLSGELNVLHNMGWHATEGGFGQGSSSSHCKHFRFPTSKPIIHIVNDGLKINFSREVYGR